MKRNKKASRDRKSALKRKEIKFQLLWCPNENDTTFPGNYHSITVSACLYFCDTVVSHRYETTFSVSG